MWIWAGDISVLLTNHALHFSRSEIGEYIVKSAGSVIQGNAAERESASCSS